jgi:hypothetical protein
MIASAIRAASGVSSPARAEKRPWTRLFRFPGWAATRFSGVPFGFGTTIPSLAQRRTLPRSPGSPSTYGMQTLWRLMTSCLISAGTFGTTFSSK